MAVLSVQQVPFAGANITFNTPAGGGDSFVNSGNVYVIIKNNDASAKTVTFDAPGTDSFGLSGSFADLAVAVPAGQQWMVGPFPPDRFNDVDGEVQMTYSAITNLTIGVVAR